MARMRFTKGIATHISLEVLSIIGNFLDKFTEEQLEDEGTLVITINALENNEIRISTIIGEEQKTVSQNYKVKKKTKSISVNYCVMGDETLLCMDYEKLEIFSKSK